MAVVLYDDFNTRITLNQASFHMRMATTCFFAAALQSLSNLLNAVATFFDPAVYAVYRIIDGIADYFSKRRGLRLRVPAIWYRLSYHTRMLWGHRKVFGFVFALAFSFQFICVTVILAAVHT